MSKVLIFGANGFVGPYLAQEFVEAGYEVYGSDTREEPRSDILRGYSPANLLDASAISEMVGRVKPDMIVNLAAISSVGQSWKMPQTTMQVNVVGTLNILEAVKELDSPSRLMLIGSSEEYAPSTEPLSEESPIIASNPYGISKATQERFAQVYAERYGIRVYRVRAFNHTGVGQSDAFVLPSWCKQVAAIECSGKPGVIRVGNLSVKRDFSDVRDIVRAYRMIIESDYHDEVFNVGSGIARPLEELLNTIISFSSQPIEVEVDSELLRPSDNPVICCNYEKAATMLEWQPIVGIDTTLRNMFENCIKTSL